MWASFMLSPMISCATAKLPLPSTAPAAAQMPIWVRPTAPTPMILPAINCIGLTLESRTSTTREVFSSSTERIT